MPRQDREEGSDEPGDLVFVGANIPRDLAEMIDCVIATEAHESKSDLIRKALKHYMEHEIPESVKRGAEEVRKIRQTAQNKEQAEPPPQPDQ